MSLRSALRGDLGASIGLSDILLDDLAGAVIVSTSTALATTTLALSMDAGTTLPISFAITLQEDGTPANIEGVPMRALLKVRPWDPDSAALATMTTANGLVVITEAAFGYGVLTIPASATGGIAGVALLSLSLRAYLPDGSIYDPLNATITCTQWAVSALTFA